MPKITIYVPRALKTDMDSLGAQQNWSAIAQSAFRTACKARVKKPITYSFAEVKDAIMNACRHL